MLTVIVVSHWLVFGLLLFALGGAIAAMSDTIYGVIIGRAIAGGGAVSAVVMALLADVTREENRMKAMAVMGMSIGMSFVVAFQFGAVVDWIGRHFRLVFGDNHHGSGCHFDVFLVPKVTRHHKNFQQGYLPQLKQVLKMGDLNRLHISVFALHLYSDCDVYLRAFSSLLILQVFHFQAMVGIFTFTGAEFIFCFSEHYSG